jgi:cellulose synthase operon protein YhjU
MGIWSFYFFGKLFLYAGGYIDFSVALNLAFALLLVVPLAARSLRIARQLLAVPAGVALLYHDSWLPPIRRALSQVNNLSQFDAAYLIELLGRFINPSVLLILLLMLLAYILLSRKLRMSTFALVAILLVPLGLKLVAAVKQPAALETAATAAGAATPATPATPAAGAVAVEKPASGPELDSILANFYRQEAVRKVSFSAPIDDKAPFDVVVLHICSLAWDDMAEVNFKSHPLMSRFDLVFDNFSSAASYSGPAAIRVLRGSCGQQKHEDLYRKTAPECYLFNQLQQAGFTPEYLMNHDGHFGGFIGDVRTNGGLSAPLADVSGVPSTLRSFDGTPVYDDYAELARWWQQRQSQPDTRVALYYNSISLHDGNKFADGRSVSAVESYRLRVGKLLDEVDRFFQQITASGRRVVVVLVPEHGAGLRGDKLQISGLREIPTAAISLVPVGIKLFGLSPAATAPQHISQPSSYLAMSQVLAGFSANNPYEAQAFNLADYTRDLPQTEFVAENEGNVVMRQAGRYMMRNPDLSWTEYPRPAP